MKKVSFYYGSGSGFSGQRFAMEMLVDGLRQRGWKIQVVTTPLRDRIKTYGHIGNNVDRGKLILRLFVAWFKGLHLAFSLTPMIVAPGQTKFALLRDGFPLLVQSLFKKHCRVIISLHGNVFMKWQLSTLEARLLRRIVKTARYITVLGPNQLMQLITLGIPKEKIIILDNTCLLKPLTEQTCIAKQSKTTHHPIEVLYLSSLIETKGYVEFVTALSRIAKQNQHHINATLCGTFTIVNSERFSRPEEAEIWIEQQIETINRSSKVHLQWINGATGKEKQNLFTKAHIFVLPSRYKVEAQPIVLLEALASGCAIVTSKVGEIPSTVSNQSAILLDEISPKSIANAIIELHDSSLKRQTLATEGLRLFEERFSYSKHIDKWEALLCATIEQQN